MTPRRLPLRPDTIASQYPFPVPARLQAAPAGWTRKTLAIAMHITCLGLFGLTVVWPVASPIASGELAREFKPVLEVLAAWTR
jgi:hypothetical protein